MCSGLSLYVVQIFSYRLVQDFITHQRNSKRLTRCNSITDSTSPSALPPRTKSTTGRPVSRGVLKNARVLAGDAAGVTEICWLVQGKAGRSSRSEHHGALVLIAPVRRRVNLSHDSRPLEERNGKAVILPACFSMPNAARLDIHNVEALKH